MHSIWFHAFLTLIAWKCNWIISMPLHSLLFFNTEEVLVHWFVVFFFVFVSFVNVCFWFFKLSTACANEQWWKKKSNSHRKNGEIISSNVNSTDWKGAVQSSCYCSFEWRDIEIDSNRFFNGIDSNKKSNNNKETILITFQFDRLHKKRISYTISKVFILGMTSDELACYSSIWYSRRKIWINSREREIEKENECIFATVKNQLIQCKWIYCLNYEVNE